MKERNELIIITKSNVACALLTGGNLVLENDTEEKLFLRDVIFINIPDCIIKRTLFKGLPCFGRIGIENYKPVIIESLGESNVQSLDEIIKKHMGFIIPFEEAFELFCGYDQSIIERELSSSFAHLGRIPEIGGALRRAAKSKAALS